MPIDSQEQTLMDMLSKLKRLQFTTIHFHFQQFNDYRWHTYTNKITACPFYDNCTVSSLQQVLEMHFLQGN